MVDETAPDDLAIDAARERVAGGDTGAFAGIVRHFERPLRAWLAAHAPPGVDVDEVAQRSFVVAYSRLDEFTPGTSFAAWLFTIARFQLRTETTRLRRIADYHARYGPDLLRRELDRRSNEPPERWTVQLEHLQRCVAALEEPLRRFVRWRYEEEIPLEEMVARSGRSLAAVKKQLWKIRQQLQECVEARLARAEGGHAG